MEKELIFPNQWRSNLIRSYIRQKFYENYKKVEEKTFRKNYKTHIYLHTIFIIDFEIDEVISYIRKGQSQEGHWIEATQIKEALIDSADFSN